MFAYAFRAQRSFLMMAVAASVMAPSSLVAQQAAEPVSAVTAAPTTSSRLLAPPGPAAWELFAVAPDASALTESGEAVLLPGRDVRTGPNVALMIVGGAALVTGLVVGGDGGLIIATGGAVVGLLGLYRYLR